VGSIGRWWLPVAMAAMMLGFLALNVSYLDENFGFHRH
jgi:hypothetical protein